MNNSQLKKENYMSKTDTDKLDEQTFDQLDKNKDGVLTTDEAVEVSEPQEKDDSNSDGEQPKPTKAKKTSSKKSKNTDKKSAPKSKTSTKKKQSSSKEKELTAHQKEMRRIAKARRDHKTGVDSTRWRRQGRR